MLPYLQVPECLAATGATSVAIFCCGAPPDLPTVDAALTARRARGIVLLLDEDVRMPARGYALRIAAAAAADMLPPITCVLWHAHTAPAAEPAAESSGMHATSVHRGSQAGGVAVNAAVAPSAGNAAHGQQLASPSRAAARAAVRAAVEGMLGAVPADDAPFMASGA